MSRSILLPLLGLGAIILFGTTRASRPPLDVSPPAPPERVELVTPEPLLRAPTAAPKPPPAPRLRSEAEPDSVGADAANPDSAAATPEAGDAPTPEDAFLDDADDSEL